MYNLITCLENACKVFSDRIAIADEKSAVSYQELLIKIRRIASSLILLKKRNRPYVIFMDRGVDCITTMLGVVFSGNFYVVLDTAMPLDRIKKIVDSLLPEAIITKQPYAERLKEQFKDIPIFHYETVISAVIDNEALQRIQRNVTDTDPVYVLYTSGSTGQPKGALISHRALLTYTSWFINTFDINKETVFGSQTPLYFSMSVSDLFGSLRTGARYQIIPKKLFSFPERLIEYMNQYNVNTIYWVPSALSIIAYWDTFSFIKPRYLEKVLFAGEAMPNKHLNYWRKHFPNLLYANLFGPTETTDICCYYIVDRPFSDDENLPIGYACDNCGLIILDQEGKEADRGELLVKGSFLANGYYNNPDKTAEVFVQNPVNRRYPETVYRTGDLVERNKKGELIYIGRNDYQIKHMGYRIELGEIETNVNAIERVRSCVCIYDDAEDMIILIYEGRINKEDVAQNVNYKLPGYMLPGKYVRMKKIPRNANGKIDRPYLQRLYTGNRKRRLIK